MANRLRMFLLVTAVLLVSASARAQPAQQAGVPRGQVVEQLVCLGDANQSYAVYLPSSYTPDRKYPILYAFDPGARGKTPVERFKEAAEKYNWIVVGSNNSRNGSMQDSVQAWNAIVTDTHERFAINDERTYATGFSGSARMALFFASRCHDCIVGVIACGAGFAAGTKPSPAMHFAFYGVAGSDDFNFRELKALEEPLTRAGMVHRIAVFGGRHEWPPAAAATAAVEWLELQAIKTGKRARDEEFVNGLWQRELQVAKTQEESHHPYEAYQVYAALAESFKGLRGVEDAERAARRLRDSREVKEAIRDEHQEIRKQADFESQINSLIAARQRIDRETRNPPQHVEAEEETRSDPEVRFQLLVSELRRQSKAAADSSERRVARRVLDGTFIGLFEQGIDLLQRQKLYDDAVTTFKLASEINPDRAGVFFYLAWSHAANRDKKKALAALKIAVEKGFADLALIAGTEAFDSIRSDPQFQQIIQGLKKSD